MALEAASFLDGLVTTNPVSSDTVAQGDDHLRLLKTVLKATFPGLDRAIYLEKAIANLASAATPDLGGTTSNYVNITGTTEIDGFANGVAGMQKLLRFDGALTLDYDATNFILPSDANIVTAAGDHAIAVCTASGVWRIVAYFRASGRALIEAVTGAETAVVARKGDLFFLQDISDANAIKRSTAQEIAETARVTVSFEVFDAGTTCYVGDVAGNAFWTVPAWMNSFDLVAVNGTCWTAGSGSSMTVQVRNVTQAADMLSSKLTFASAAITSTTATIDASNDDIVTGDRLVIDVDTVHTTPAVGLVVNLTFERPAS
jgi:hypothetical protein